MEAMSQSGTRRLCPSEGELSESVMASFVVKEVWVSISSLVYPEETAS